MKRAAPSRLAHVGLLALSALLCACGSTVQTTGQEGYGVAAGDSLGLPAGDGLGSPLGGGAGGAGTGAGSLDGSGGGTLGSGASAGSGGGAASGNSAAGASGSTAGGIPQGAATGQGWTESQITIGIATSKDAEATSTALGLQGVSPGDTEAATRAVAAYINARGGILGRKIVLAPHDYNSMETLSNPGPANQEACVDWTQDQKVFAVMLGNALVEDTLLSCLQKANTPLVSAGGGADYPLHYADTYAKYPDFFNIGQMVGDRYDRIAFRRLAERKFFSGWDTSAGAPGSAKTVVGLIMPANSAVKEASWRKQLSAVGYPVSDGNVVTCPADVVGIVNCQQNAVLKMKSAGVTHIVGAGVPFMNTAENQRYRPRYFLPVTPRTFASNAPAAQLVGSFGESYVPILDVGSGELPGDPSPATGRCRDIMKAAGLASGDLTVTWNQHIICDGLFFLAAGLEKAGSIGKDQLRRGLESLGSSEPSAVTWGTFLGPTEHTSATVLRDLAFNSSSKKFVYVSKTNYGDR